MNKSLKNYLKNLLFRKGYKLSKINSNLLQDSNVFNACNSEINLDDPIVFDVGMNHGQTLKKILKVFPSSQIHGFEASKYCFEQTRFSDDPSYLEHCLQSVLLQTQETEELPKFFTVLPYGFDVR